MFSYAKINIPLLDRYTSDHPSWVSDNWAGYFFKKQKNIRIGGRPGTKNTVLDPTGDKKARKMLDELLSYLNKTEQRLYLYSIDETAAVVGYGQLRFVLPSDVVEQEPLTDYAGFTSDTLKSIGSAMDGSLPSLPSESQNSLLGKKEELDEYASFLDEEQKCIEDGTSQDLAELKSQLDALQKEMEKQKASLMAKLQEKKDELARKRRKLEKDILILDTQIYGIRCYSGEVSSFYRIRKGKPSPEEEPVVIYQKIRFLDEELGKYLSIYAFGNMDRDIGDFLTVLKERDDMADLFAPGPKSVSVVKLSRTGTYKAASSLAASMLSEYSLYHENQLAILIRDGENLSISWLDPDKIMLSEEDLFYSAKTEVTSPADISEKRSSTREDILSRWFFFNILQGVLDRGVLLRVPEKVSVTEVNSPYITFSAADAWLYDDRYGSFSDLLKKSSNIPLKKGDMILTGTKISREYTSTVHDSWDNERGIGEKNRTRGKSLPALEIMPVNKVLPSVKAEYTIRTYAAVIKEIMVPWYRSPDGRERSTHKYDGWDYDGDVPSYNAQPSQEAVSERKEEKIIPPDKWYGYKKSVTAIETADLLNMSGISARACFVIRRGRKVYLYDNKLLEEAWRSGETLLYESAVDARVVDTQDPQYYASVRCTGCDRDYQETTYYVNLQFMPDEVIPLTFLCPTWIRHVINTGNVGDISLCGAKMSYVDMLKYFHKMLPHLDEIAEKEKSILMKAGGEDFVAQHPDWDAILTEWKISHECHSMTELRARRFLREVKEGGKTYEQQKN